MRDIDIAVVNGLKVLDPKRPIREGDMTLCLLVSGFATSRARLSGAFKDKPDHQNVASKESYVASSHCPR